MKIRKIKILSRIKTTYKDSSGEDVFLEEGSIHEVVSRSKYDDPIVDVGGNLVTVCNTFGWEKEYEIYEGDVVT